MAQRRVRGAKRFFISHVTTEAPVASVLRKWLENAGATAFVASEDVSAGTIWLEEIRRNLSRADVVLLLASRRSVTRNWVWFEAGCAWADVGRRCVPVCFEESFGKDDLPSPLDSMQAIDIHTDAGRTELVDLVAPPNSPEGDRPSPLDRRELQEAVQISSRINPRTDRTLSAPTGRGVLIDLSHDQTGWPRPASGLSLLREEKRLLSALEIDESISLSWVGDPRQLWRHDLSNWSGLVMALPYHVHAEDFVGEELRAWVKSGGRLLLLGFELGDRHHKSNLNQIADLFGLRFNSDIVAPDAVFSGKPYDKAIDVPVGDTCHALLDGVGSLRVWNAQTVSSEPGGTPLIPLTGLGVSLLGDEDIHYDDAGNQESGYLTFRPSPAPADRHLAVFAPPDLCGYGSVLGLGTWDLRLGPDADGTRRFVSNLIGWLAAEREASPS